MSNGLILRDYKLYGIDGRDQMDVERAVCPYCHQEMKLKSACPFCGGTAVVEAIPTEDRTYYIVKCQKCEVRTKWQKEPGEAVKAWERRGK